MTTTQMNATPFLSTSITDLPEYDDFDEFAELKEALHVMSLVVCSLVSLLGVIGNGLVIWVTGFKMKKTVNTVWLLNLALADFLLLIFLPFHITSLALDAYWPFGAVMCKITHTSLMLNMYASVLILMVISMDRCVSVTRPVWAQNHRNVRKASFVSLSVWLLALVLSVPILVVFNTSEYRDVLVCSNEVDQTGSHIMIVTHFLLGFSLPFIVIVTCYAVIIYTLQKKRTLASQSRHAFKIISAIIVAFFLCWTPHHLLGIIVIKDDMTGNTDDTFGHIINIGHPIALTLAFLNSCLNPLLYVFMGQDFKNRIFKSLPKVLETLHDEEGPLSQTYRRAVVSNRSKNTSSTKTAV
ncbi:Chemokine-like receptor 1 [Oryzias melastigma]|uniref:Chemokine-like receptor 1 n=1 Tax=Oryzias melastigma TaxID=30732 RepID=A0A834FSX0_ORYME|nr:Chemokine-like receptor 1 [Oryzias melastigma]